MNVDAPGGVPTVDVAAWRSGDGIDRAEVAASVDHALRTSGFLLVTDHGVPAELAAAVRRHASRFFALPAEVKEPYRCRVGGRGWIPPGAESNSYAAGVAAPPDLKESFALGHPVPDAVLDPVWPTEVPELQASAEPYLDHVWALALDLFELFAAALGLPAGTLVQHASAAVSQCNINRYPSLAVTGRPEPGQFRIGAHSDFGVLTILDRQVGYGGLQIQALDGTWLDAPHVPGALTVNIGDLLAHWTGGRWRSTFHRVLPPSERDPGEELLSLVAFCGVAPSTLVETFPVEGAQRREPILAGDYMLAKLTQIDVVDATPQATTDAG
jgi:isopenicillin N synthase-like dioxygenase